MKSNAELFAELGVKPANKPKKRRLLEERVLEGFEDIQLFFDEHNRLPSEDADDIFERRYAVRLRRIVAQGKVLSIVRPEDHQGLIGSFRDGLG